jgi:hypothetical protein
MLQTEHAGIIDIQPQFQWEKIPPVGCRTVTITVVMLEVCISEVKETKTLKCTE